jgi:hypothetical protein
MVDAKTKLSDVIIQERVVQGTLELLTRDNAPWNSGIYRLDPILQAYTADSGADIIKFPVAKKYQGPSTLINPGETTIYTNKTSMVQQIAPKELRAVAFQEDMVAVNKSGIDFNVQLVNDLSNYWPEEFQRHGLSRADRVFASTAGAAYVNNISEATLSEDRKIDSAAMQDTTKKLGIGRQELGFMVVHPDISVELSKQDDFMLVADSEGRQFLNTYKGLRVIESEEVGPWKIDSETGLYELVDGEKVRAESANAEDIYNTYFFKPGAFAYGVARPYGITPLESQSVPELTSEKVFSRLAVTMHLNGSSFTSSTVNEANLLNATNWDIVVTKKRDFSACLLQTTL